MSILFFDIETDGTNPETANLKWFGAFSTIDNKYHLLDFKQKDEILNLITNHKVVVGFNCNGFDIPIINNYFNDDVFNYKIKVDLWQCLAPKPAGNQEFGKWNIGRLPQMGICLPNYKLKTIIEYLKLDNNSKGDIDYNIFKKDDWSNSEIEEIKKYLKQDIVLTQKLFNWYDEQFKPLCKYLPDDDVRKYNYLRNSISEIAYKIFCKAQNKNPDKLKRDDAQKTKQQDNSIEGGHHILPLNDKKLFVGNIIELDFASAYPHAIIQGNLFSHQTDGWNGNNYYNLQGKYNHKEQGVLEKLLIQILNERLDAKATGNKAKNISYKLIINSVYGLCGSPIYKHLYNPTTANDCTSIVRTWIKKLAKHLHENGFECFYGFTDSIFILIPPESNKYELMIVVNSVMNEFKQNIQFPKDSFKMDIEVELKLMWVLKANRYLYLTQDDKIFCTSTLLNSNIPKIIRKLFDEFMTQKIIKDLDVNFSKIELLEILKQFAQQDIKLCTQKYNVLDIDSYKSKTSIQAQISSKYGSGSHNLIPINRNDVGVGVMSRWCSYDDFVANNLTIEDINFKNLLNCVKDFTGGK